ncbi:MAG: S8 family serine peptidase [Polyangiaceae bacterium]|nr:S8 family serine peptidase [Polyangiaceae bacterium]
MRSLPFIFALGLGVFGVAACAPNDPPDEAPEPTAPASAPISKGSVAPYFVVLDGPSASQMIPHGLDPRSKTAGDITKKRVREIEAEQAAIEPQLVAHGAEVIARISRLANMVEVLVDEAGAKRIAKLHGVQRVELVPLLERSLASAVPLVGATNAWTLSPGVTGDGIRIGIIDSGIDYTHADFGGPGTIEAYQGNDTTLIEPGTFPTAKVIGGLDFVGDDYDASGAEGSATAHSDPDPLDCSTTLGEQISGGHGTHVSGIAAGQGVLADGATYAGPYNSSVDLDTFRVAPGVAPEAKLFALKIFGCHGSTAYLASALDRAADPNNDGVFDDRLDVVNGSLGTGYALGTTAVGGMMTELTSVGTLVVAAAGNDRQNFFSVGSPGTYAEVLAVAGTSDNKFFSLRVTTPTGEIAYPAAESMFSARLITYGPVSAPIVQADPPLACGPLTNAADIAGKIALIDRGTCPFVDKTANAEAAGALAVIVVDDEDQALPFAMSGDPGSSNIPALLVTLDNGTELKTLLTSGVAPAELDPADIYTGPGAELLAGFSSRGPSPIDLRMKPEIAAPGILDSAACGSGNAAVPNGGTSMASPMVAGGAALVRQAHPDLGPMEVKALLMNAAAPLSDLAGVKYGTSVVGAGRMDVAKAVKLQTTAATDLAAGEIGVSFGSIAVSNPVEVEKTFTVTNHGATASSFELTVDPTYELSGATIVVEPSSIDLEAGASAVVTMTLALDPVALGNAGPDPGTPAMQGNQEPEPRHYLNQTSGVVRLHPQVGDDLVLPYTGAVRAASSGTGTFAPTCEDDPAKATIDVEGEGAHPAPTVTVLSLAATDDADPDSETDPGAAQADLLAVGVATDRATAADGEAKVYFGLVVNGPWTTPARGPISVVKVQVDCDETSGYDFEIRTEARNPQGPFRDALIASTYNMDSDERLGRFPVNILRPDVASTYPFNSTVLVLSASFADLGLDGDDLNIKFRAQTERADTLTNGDSVNGEIDLANLPIDASPYGYEGAPIFVGDQPLVVDVAPGFGTADSPADALLLHHTNAPGQQWEVVSIARETAGALSIAGVGPADPIAAGATADVELTVTNASTTPAPNVSISGTATGGEIVAATISQGTCSSGAAIACTVEELAPGATVSVHATVQPSEGVSAVTLNASVDSELACDAPGDDVASVSIAVSEPEDDDGPPPEPRDGCDCSTQGRGEGSAWFAAFAVIGAAVARRRRSAR